MKLALATVLSALLVLGIASVSMGQSTGAVTRSKLYRSDPSVNSVRGRDPFAPRPNNAGRGGDPSSSTVGGLIFTSTNGVISLPAAGSITSSTIRVSAGGAPVQVASVEVRFVHYDPSNLSLQLVQHDTNGVTKGTIKLWTGFPNGPLSQTITEDLSTGLIVYNPGLNDIAFSDSASVPIGNAYVTNSITTTTNIVGATTSLVFSSAFIGTFIPEAPLSSLGTVSSDGDWVLILDNTISGDSGSYFVSWTLGFNLVASGGNGGTSSNFTLVLPRSLADLPGVGTTNLTRSQSER